MPRFAPDALSPGAVDLFGGCGRRSAKRRQKGSYNPVALRYGLTDGEWTEESRAALALTLDRSIRVMAASYELYDFGVWSDIIQSVVYEGMYAVGHSVLDGTFHQRARKRKKIPV